MFRKVLLRHSFPRRSRSHYHHVMDEFQVENLYRTIKQGNTLWSVYKVSKRTFHAYRYLSSILLAYITNYVTMAFTHWKKISGIKWEHTRIFSTITQHGLLVNWPFTTRGSKKWLSIFHPVTIIWFLKYGLSIPALSLLTIYGKRGLWHEKKMLSASGEIWILVYLICANIACVTPLVTVHWINYLCDGYFARNNYC